MNYDRAKEIKELLNSNTSYYWNDTQFLRYILEIELDKIIDSHEADNKIKEHLEKQNTRQDVDF